MIVNPKKISAMVGGKKGVGNPQKDQMMAALDKAEQQLANAMTSLSAAMNAAGPRRSAIKEIYEMVNHVNGMLTEFHLS